MKTSKRMPGDAREKALLLAIHRIQNGRAHTKATKLTFGAVAAEAGGISESLIHNRYPRVADHIRELQNRGHRTRRDELREEVKRLKAHIRNLDTEIADLKAQRKLLVTRNEMLHDQVKVLTAGAKVSPLRRN